MIGNPRGYGKSALVKEFAYKRDEISRNYNIPSGPVLFTDFSSVRCATDAQEKISKTIRPLFLSFGLNLTREKGFHFDINLKISI